MKNHFWNQLKTLMWKNAILKIRNPFVLLLELIVPCVVMIGLVALRSQIKANIKDESFPNSFSVSEGFEEMYGTPPCGGENLVWRCAVFDGCDRVSEDDFSNCQRRYIAVAPSNGNSSSAWTASKQFVDWANEYVDAPGGQTTFVHFESEGAFNSYYKSSSYSRQTSINIYSTAIIFLDGAPAWDYKIRLNKTVIFDEDEWSTPQTKIDAVQDNIKTPDQFPSDDSSFGSKPYLETYNGVYYFTLASTVNSFINTVTCRNAGLCNATENVDVNVVGVADFPNVEETLSGFWGQVGDFFALLMIISLLYPLSNIIKSLVVEKETRVREGFMIMSMRSDALWLSWMIHFLCLFLPLSIILTIIGSALFIYSEAIYIFLYFFMFLMASTSYTILISVMFSKSKAASIVGCLLFFGGYFIYVGLSSNTFISRSQLMAACLHPATAFTYGTLAFREYEDAKIGVTEFTYDQTSTYKITFADTIVMQTINFFYLLVLAWYLAEVWPSEYGTSKPVYFLFQSHYWKGIFKPLTRMFGDQDTLDRKRVSDESPPSKQKAIEMGHLNQHPEQNDQVTGSGTQGNAINESQPNVEAVPDTLRSQIESNRCIVIKNLVKSFDTPTGVKNAVDGLDLVIYSEQITALLGHNGAGKTTAISMLTGLIPITSGSATINGIDVGSDIDEIRRSIGYCPQHDVLIPDLTVEEHLYFFANVKGCDAAEIPGEVEKMIESIGLGEIRNRYSMNLSGGQKRKLSLGIAFIGKSKIVFLDEPTSGMDPYSRRFTWNVIRKYREGRIIVLTTHFMDEADLLGDRIAIMSHGKLRCCGSNLYLKQKYGVGYSMVMEKKDPNHFDSKNVTDIIKQYVPDCNVLTDVGAEMTVQLSFKSSGSFDRMFQALDANLDRIGIRSYGISATTLEEVFIRVAAGEVISKKSETKSAKIPELTGSMVVGEIGVEKAVVASDESADDGVVVLGGGAKHEEAQLPTISPALEQLEKYREDQTIILFFVHLWALLEKRYFYFKRDSKSWVFQYVVPVVFVIIGMIVMKYSPIFTDQPSIVISHSLYNKGISTDYLPFPFTANDTVCPFQSNCSLGENSISGQTGIMQNVEFPNRLPIEPLTLGRTVYDVSFYLLENRKDYKASRFGAVTFLDIQSNDPNVNSGWISSVSYVVHANFTGVHAGPLFTHLVAEALVRVFDSASSIKLRLHPLEETDRESSQYSAFNATNVILFLLLALPFIPASFALFVVREKEIKSKHLQLVSGVSVAAYWIGTWIWDVSTYMISAWLMIMCISVFPGTELFTEGDAFGALCILFILFGAAIAPFAYLCTFFLKNSAGTQTALLFVVFVTGLILMIVGVVLRLIPDTDQIWMSYLRFIFMLFPAHAFGDALNSMVVIDFISFLELGGDSKYSVYDYNITGYGMIYLGVESIAYLALVILIDYVIQTPWARVLFMPSPVIPDTTEEEPRDIDVLEEEEKVKSGVYDQASKDRNAAQIILRDVKKVYGKNIYAVRGVSLGIANGECFGLLGINGAGKTTLLGVVSGEFPPSAGTATLAGLDILNDIHRIRHRIGYCPQFDALFDLLTGREHLMLYAQIKGLKKDSIIPAVNAKIAEMGLTEYADRSAGTYSGGNKRKLSVAMAMIGEPSIVFLDEPSTGMDPVARRSMWEIISDISTKREKCSIVLTTQSMEECEALCSRIGIMVAGVLRCLGSGQRLRDRYGLGYQIEISLLIPEIDNDESAQLLYNDLLNISGSSVPSNDAPSVFESGDIVRLTEEQIKSMCSKKDHGNWLSRFTREGSGGELLLEIETNGSVGLKFFTSWWILEERADRLCAFFDNNFAGYVVRERQTARVRLEVPFKVPGTEELRTLSKMFGLLESNKNALAINEYSIAQTSLEQIFNGFASKQLAEEAKKHA